MDAERENVVVITGAGASVAAGLATYREAGGVWADEAFQRMSQAQCYGNYLPQLKPRWRSLHQAMTQAKPTSFHRRVAERGWRVITQNVDGLHQKAGSQEVLEVHGSLATWRCLRCKKTFAASLLEKMPPEALGCPLCSSHRVRPQVVLFGEGLQGGRQAEAWVRQASVVVYAGTSGEVEPVASWHAKAKRSVLVDPHPWEGAFTSHYAMTTEEWTSRGMPLA